MTYPLHFRKKILKEAKEKGVVVTAERYGLSTRSINEWKKRIEPKTTRNRTDHKVSKEALLKDVSDFPDSFIHERAERFNVSKSCMQYSLKRCGISNKKNTQSSKRRQRQTKTI